MRIERSFTVAAPIGEVWAEIRDPGRMVSCVPGCESIEPVGEETYRAVVAVSVGPISARFNLTVEILEEEPPYRVRTATRGEEGSRASLVQAESEMRLRETDAGGTEIVYVSDVEIGGRLGRYGAGMMKKIAERKAATFEETFCGRLEAREGSNR